MWLSRVAENRQVREPPQSSLTREAVSKRKCHRLRGICLGGERIASPGRQSPRVRKNFVAKQGSHFDPAPKANSEVGTMRAAALRERERATARWMIRSVPTLTQGWVCSQEQTRNMRSKCRCSCVLQFTCRLAASCVLHRPPSQLIHCMAL